MGAQSSLTGGATPFGESVLSLTRMDSVGPTGAGEIAVEAGVPLRVLAEKLHEVGFYYPPVPTFTGALVGGTASTNAAGAATFKYGSTRDWVQRLTVMLASGDVLDLERGACTARPEGFFEIELLDGTSRRVPVPTYTMPDVKKCSAGYYAKPGMDLIDLFIGAEGTLGVITALGLRLIPEPSFVLGFGTFEQERVALEATSRLRRASEATWAHGGPGVDVRSIEFLDRRSLALLREDGSDLEHGFTLAHEVEAAILFEMEIKGSEASCLETLASLLSDLDCSPVIASSSERAQHLRALREAVPMAVNHRVASLQRTFPGVHKTAADMVVPYDRLPEALSIYRSGFSRRGLDHALWGHVSDGNVHANVIPRSEEDVRNGEEAILEFGDEILKLGGCPLSEHGVGRNSVKQALLQRLYGEKGIREMQGVKAALDPGWKLAPGVLFPVPSA